MPGHSLQMTLSSAGRTLVVVCAFVLVSFMRAAFAADRGPIVVQVLSGADEIDESALRDAVSRELGVRALAANDADASRATSTLTVGIEREHHELVVARRAASGTIVRRIALPADREAVTHAAVFLIGNLARDEASELLGEMSAREPAPVLALPAAPAQVDSAPSPPPTPPPSPRRFWLGLTIEGGLAVLPSSNDTCTLAATGAPSGGYACVDGARDYPSATQSAGVTPGLADRVAPGLAFTNARYLATFNYAATDNVLVGGRLGFAGETYPGARVSAFGHLHVEARAAYVLGAHALASRLVSPAFMLGVGAAEMSARVPVTVIESGGVARSVNAWRVAGPLFASVGVGVRFAPSSSFALTAYVAKATLAFGSSSILAFTPEIGAEVGF